MIKVLVQKVFNLAGYQIVKNYNSDHSVNAVEYNKLQNVNTLNKNFKYFLKNTKKDSVFIDCIFPFIKKHIDSENLKVLDIGCGTGTLVNKLVEENVSKYVYGCDFSFQKIQKCNEFYENDIFFVHDVYNFLSDTYDVIICTEVLEHLEYPVKSLENMLLSLNNGGKLIISVPDGRKDTFFGHINFWSPESFKIFVGEAISNKQHCKYESIFYYMCGKNISLIKKIK